MCPTVRCRTCSKTTWTGCGGHVDAVKAHVPEIQWCVGHDDIADRRGTLRKPFGM